MNDTMRQLLPVIVVAVFVAVVIPHIGQFGPLFAILAACGWISLAVWVLYRAQMLPRPVLWLFDRIRPGRRLEVMKAEEEEAIRRRLAADVTAGRLQTVLDDWLIGQTALTGAVARSVEIFVGKKNPGKPLSLLLAGPSGSGRTTFAEALSAALSPFGAGRLMRIDCANDAAVDFTEIGGKLAGLTLPILLFDNLDKFGDQRHAGLFMAELSRLLDVGAIAGQPVLRRAIILQTMLLDPSAAAGAYREAAARTGEFDLVMRHVVRTTNRLPEELVNRVDLVAVTKPLADVEQIAIVWKTFCSMAAKEHEIQVVEEDLGLGDGIEDFLIEARERWLKAGVSGVREAARFVASAADDAFLKASRLGVTRVRARWDHAQGQIALDPAPIESRHERSGSWT